MKAVIENASRFIALESGTNEEKERTAVLRDWQAQVVEKKKTEEPGEKLIGHIRKNYLIPRSTPLKSILQSLGFIPGAHFPGCQCYMPEVAAS